MIHRLSTPVVFIASLIILQSCVKGPDARSSAADFVSTLFEKKDYFPVEKITKQRAKDPSSFYAWEMERHNCGLDYAQVHGLREDFLREMKNALLNRDIKALTKLGLSSFTLNLGLGAQPARRFEQVEEFAWVKERPLSLADYIKQFERVDYVDLQVKNFMIPVKSRSKDFGFSKVMLVTALDVRGRDVSKRLRQDYASFLITMKKDQHQWLPHKLLVKSGKTVMADAKRKASFREATKMSNLAQSPVYLRTEAIRRGGYALSITDYNNDKIPDLFVGLRDKAQMWRGKGDGTFSLVSTGLEHEKYVKTAVFADFDNDGDQDVVINRFLDDPKRQFAPDVDVVHYINHNGRFQLSKYKLNGEDHFREPMPSSVADFNGDGHLDLYVGYPGVRDFSALYNYNDEKGKRVQGLYLNDRRGKLLDFTEETFIVDNSSNYTYKSFLFPHSSLAIDFNQDRLMDLLVIDDRGNLSPVYMNVGKGKMMQSEKRVGIENYGYGMSATSGDLNNDGVVDLAITNVHFSDQASYTSSCEHNWKIGVGKRHEKGLTVYHNNGQGRFSEVSDQLHLSNPGESTGGLTFFDYNNDGHQDIYVTNGLWSGTPDGQELAPLFSLIMTNKGKFYALRSRDRFRFMDLLQETKGRYQDIFDLTKIKRDGSVPSFAGYQRNRLYRNNGDDTFTDVAFVEGVDSISDGYIVGRGDFNRDGILDLVLRNADPGSKEHSYLPVQLYLGEKTNDNKGVTLTFEGRQSNRDAIGLYAIAYFNGIKQVQHLEGNSGSMSQQRFLHFGLGRYAKIDKLEVFWPAGHKQIFRNLKHGHHHLKESYDRSQLKASL